MRIGKLRKLFGKDEQGNVGMLFAFAMVPATLLAGGATDIGQVFRQQAKLQASADAAALAAAGPADISSSDRIAIATKVFGANATSANLAGVVPQIVVDGDTVRVAAGLQVSTPFLNVMHIASMDASATSTARARSTVSDTNPGKVCLLALDPASADGIHVQGDNQVNYADCWSHTNSTLSSAINGNGSNARVNGKGHCAVGGYESTHEGTYSPVVKTNCRVVRDPFAVVSAYDPVAAYESTFTAPTKAVTCKANNLALKKGTFTLDPGRYCGGIDVKAGAAVTLNPGIYYIDNGVFNVQSGSSVSGSNILLYLEGAAARMQVIGGGVTNLSGRHSSASFAGFLAIAHPNANPMGESNIQGGGVYKLQGVIYMPKQRIEVSGNGDVNNADIAFFSMIAKDFYFRGNGVFNVKRHTGSGHIPDIMPTMPVEEIRSTALE